MEQIEENLLQCQSKDVKLRMVSYNELSLIFAKHKELWGDHLQKDQMKKIIENITEDMNHENVEVGYASAGFLVPLVENQTIMKKITVPEETKICKSIIMLLKKSEAKKVLTRGLLALVRGKFSQAVYKNNIHEILKATKTISASECNNLTKFETVQVIKSLLEKVPSLMKKNIDNWLGIVVEPLTHENGKVRDTCYLCLTATKTLFQEEADVLRTHLSPYILSLKTKQTKTMITLLEQDCNGIIRIWSLLVVLLGPALHAGTSLVNSLLEVVERAFKSRSSETRVRAFEAWVVLINNFALDKKLLDHPKRLKLLVAPFRSNNSGSEDIAEAKLLAWWHLVCCFDKTVPEHFDIVITPFLKFAFQLSLQTGLDRSLAKTISPAKKFPCLTVQSAEMLLLLLKKPGEEYHFSIPHSGNTCITNSVFGRHYQILFKCAVNVFTVLDAQLSDQLLLGKLLLTSLFHHVNKLLCEKEDKKDAVDMVKEFTSFYSQIEELEFCGAFVQQFMQKMISGPTAFPASVMNSRTFNVPTGSKITDVMNGTLNNYIIHKTLKPRFLDCCDSQSHLNIWKDLIQKSNPPSGKLYFFQFIIHELTTALAVLENSKTEIIFELWLQTTHQLLAYIQLEKHVNQGDSSEHDWSCMYQFFLFPIQYFEELHLSQQSNLLKLLDVWGSLWKEFSGICASTATAEPNSECEQVAKKILDHTKESKPMEKKDPLYISFLSDLLTIILKYMKFSELGKKSIKTIQSPAKVRVKSHPLYNLASCVNLFCFLLENALALVCYERSKVVKSVVKCGDLILKNTPVKMAWPLISSLTELFAKAMEVNPSAKFNAEVANLIVDLWDTFANIGEAFLRSKCELEHFSLLTPVFVSTLSSSNSDISDRAKKFWLNSFHKSEFTVPNCLAQVLKKVMVIPESASCDIFESPPAKSVHKKALEESPSIRLAKFVKSSEKPVQLIASPISPQTTPSFKVPGRVSLEDMKDEDFVVINTPKARKRLLTAHQAEKMMERAEDIPAMYNDLSQSSSGLPPGFATQDSIDNSESADAKAKLEAADKILSFQGCFTPESKKKTKASPSQVILTTASETKSAKKADLPHFELFNEDAQFVETISEIQDDGKENRKKRKRKGVTPAKKSLDDIRQSLKGKKSSDENLSPKKQLSERNLPTKRRRAARLLSQNELPEPPKSDTDSETEIPDSQDVCITPLLKCNTSVQTLQKGRASPINIDPRPTKKLRPDVESSTSEGTNAPNVGSEEETLEVMDQMPATKTTAEDISDKVMNKDLTPEKTSSSFRRGDSPQEIPSTNSSPLASPLVSPTKTETEDMRDVINGKKGLRSQQKKSLRTKRASTGRSISKEAIIDCLEKIDVDSPAKSNTEKNTSIPCQVKYSEPPIAETNASKNVMTEIPGETSRGMSESLPVSDFETLKDSDKDKINEDANETGKASISSLEVNHSEHQVCSTVENLQQCEMQKPAQDLDESNISSKKEPEQKKPPKKKRGRPAKKKVIKNAELVSDTKVERKEVAPSKTDPAIEKQAESRTDQPDENIESTGVAELPKPKVPNRSTKDPSETVSLEKLSETCVTSIDNEESLESERDDSSLDVKISPMKLYTNTNKLVNSVGTPERSQMKKKSKSYSSRGAIMLACAQKNMQKRTVETEGSVDSKHLRSPSISTGTPISRRKLSDKFSDKPWAKHAPSPQSSPSVSILKKKRAAKDDDVSSSNDSFNSDCVSKPRRVSFADPPVSESVEIPPSPRNHQGYVKPVKKLNMALANKSNADIVDRKPIYPTLKDSTVPIETLVSLLPIELATDNLLSLFTRGSINTIGDVCSLCSKELVDIDEETVIAALQYYESDTGRSSDDADENKILVDEPAAVMSETVSSVITPPKITSENSVSRLQELLEDCPTLLKELVERSGHNVQMNILKNLLANLPHSDVIDVYCEYLKMPKISFK